MSKFSAKHPKLATAFAGAVKGICSRHNLTSTIAYTAGIAIGGALTGGALPVLIAVGASAAASNQVLHGVIGARKALKAAKISA